MSANDAIPRKRVPKLEKSLAILLRSLLGTCVVIELKNDTEITGIIDETDDGMSVVLVEVTIVTWDGLTRHVDTTFVNGSSIRYVHIPPEVKMIPHLNSYMAKLGKIADGNKRHKIVDRRKPPLSSMEDIHIGNSSRRFEDEEVMAPRASGSPPPSQHVVQYMHNGGASGGET